ncbi:MAG: hypothetical protein KJZ59_10250, partial [Pararhodobacter sp.]|nr:hypothetical protein [Pararhodobacter sp.]
APLDDLALLRRVADGLSGTAATVLGLALGEGVDGVSVDLRVDDFRALDAVIEALAAAGLQADVARSGIAPEGGVSATVTVIGGAP